MLKTTTRAPPEKAIPPSAVGDLHDKYGLRVADTPRPVVATPETQAVLAPVAEQDAKKALDRRRADAQNN